MHPLKGIALKICSVITFITMASLIKATAQHVPAGHVASGVSNPPSATDED